MLFQESKQELNSEQMQHLEDLGICTDYAHLLKNNKVYNDEEDLIYNSHAHANLEYYCSVYSAFTLIDIMDILPDDVNGSIFFLEKHKYNFSDDEYVYDEHVIYEVGYKCPLDNVDIVRIKSESVIDAAYDLLCWCIGNGHI